MTDFDINQLVTQLRRQKLLEWHKDTFEDLTVSFQKRDGVKALEALAEREKTLKAKKPNSLSGKLKENLEKAKKTAKTWKERGVSQHLEELHTSQILIKTTETIKQLLEDYFLPQSCKPPSSKGRAPKPRQTKPVQTLDDIASDLENMTKSFETKQRSFMTDLLKEMEGKIPDTEEASMIDSAKQTQQTIENSVKSKSNENDTEADKVITYLKSASEWIKIKTEIFEDAEREIKQIKQILNRGEKDNIKKAKTSKEAKEKLNSRVALSDDLQEIHNWIEQQQQTEKKMAEVLKKVSEIKLSYSKEPKIDDTSKKNTKAGQGKTCLEVESLAVEKVDKHIEEIKIKILEGQMEIQKLTKEIEQVNQMIKQNDSKTNVTAGTKKTMRQEARNYGPEAELQNCDLIEIKAWITQQKVTESSIKDLMNKVDEIRSAMSETDPTDSKTQKEKTIQNDGTVDMNKVKDDLDAVKSKLVYYDTQKIKEKSKNAHEAQKLKELETNMQEMEKGIHNIITSIQDEEPKTIVDPQALGSARNLLPHISKWISDAKTDLQQKESEVGECRLELQTIRNLCGDVKQTGRDRQQFNPTCKSTENMPVTETFDLVQETVLRLKDEVASCCREVDTIEQVNNESTGQQHVPNSTLKCQAGSYSLKTAIERAKGRVDDAKERLKTTIEEKSKQLHECYETFQLLQTMCQQTVPSAHPKRKNGEDAQNIKEIVTDGVANLNDIIANLDEELKNERKKTSLVVKELERANSTISDLRNRLSKYMGANLRDGNPNIADLSDSNRPTKLAETYTEVYDNQWTNAFEELKELRKMKEVEIISSLLGILKFAFEYCGEASKAQIQGLEENISFPATNILDSAKKDKVTVDAITSEALTEFRKKTWGISSQNLIQNSEEMMKKENVWNDAYSGKQCKHYISSCIQLCWQMLVQSPPVYIHFEDSVKKLKFDKNRYKEYMQVGKEIEYVVWPPLYLHKGGGQLSKGVAQGKK